MLYFLKTLNYHDHDKVIDLIDEAASKLRMELNSKVKDLDEAITYFINKLISQNNKMGSSGKFIDVKDHFMKMNMKIQALPSTL